MHFIVFFVCPSATCPSGLASCCKLLKLLRLESCHIHLPRQSDAAIVYPLNMCSPHSI